MVDRFAAKVDMTGDCWEWTACRNADGYGRFGAGSGKVMNAHRYAYTTFVEPVADDMTIDHLCRNRGCVNPDHLEPVSRRENILRGERGHASVTNVCKRGHVNEFRRRPSGKRYCVECHAGRY